MATPHSNLSKKVTQGYWAQVRRVLRTRHKLSLTAAQHGINNYQATLAKIGVGDEIYHAQIDETVQGIVRGGYLPGSGSGGSGQKAAAPQVTRH